MTVNCPSGHPSTSTDYCDVCGLPIGAAATPAGSAVPSPAVPAPGPGTPGTPGGPTPGAPDAVIPSSTPEGQACPNCSEPAAADALFCENCGYDFTTGTMPRPPSSLDLSSGPAPATPPTTPSAPAALAEWVVERWVDPDWYAVQQSDDPCPSPGLPTVIPLTEKSLLIGRPSRSRGISPEIDCGDDTGVSRRQAQLTTDGQRWWVEDLQSSNGTYVASAAGPLPETPIIPGQRQELNPDDRVYVGAWTRLVVRKATPEEQAGQA
ncbi:double zinc ribbon protein [Kribbella sp. VKM Ac-2571]|uniref:FHA domain-containing protein n=1 Tax=Kribbella sp. VKM Ac-2571 TaxID=2512222 RepID=UPI0010618E55|nr:FHA domain-containing protein [Kribbella sp. VKM Ac-2571]TDO68171.1 double zinc ribbon protein [Kribbella sp. VKM Ac-2571]